MYAESSKKKKSYTIINSYSPTAVGKSKVRYRGNAYYCTKIFSFSFRFEKSLPILFYIHYVHQGQMGKSKYTGCIRQGVQSAPRRRIREYHLYIIL